jgi:ElaA protein
MDIQIKHYQDLEKDEFHDLVSLRIAVFIVEQNCPYQELDGLDKDAYHLTITKDDTVLATLRILEPGVYYPELAIGRVVSHPAHRKLKLGHLMMEEAMRFIKNELQLQKVRLSAQTHLIPFYQKYGFKSTGKEYLEDGIPHTEMLLAG